MAWRREHAFGTLLHDAIGSSSYFGCSFDRAAGAARRGPGRSAEPTRSPRATRSWTTGPPRSHATVAGPVRGSRPACAAAARAAAARAAALSTAALSSAALSSAALSSAAGAAAASSPTATTRAAVSWAAVSRAAVSRAARSVASCTWVRTAAWLRKPRLSAGRRSTARLRPRLPRPAWLWSGLWAAASASTERGDLLPICDSFRPVQPALSATIVPG